LSLRSVSEFVHILDPVASFFVTCGHVANLCTGVGRLRTVPAMVLILGEPGGPIHLIQVHSHMNMDIVKISLPKLACCTVMLELNQYSILFSLP
jgi:hypothetical protein